MNMKSIHVKRFLLAGTFVALFSQACTNLDEKVFSQVTQDNFFRTPEEFASALGAAYTNLYGFANHNGIFSIQEVSSDELMIPQRGNDWFDGGQWLRMKRHTFTPLEDSFNNAWSFCYSGISACNRLIAQFEAIPNSTAVIAELRVLRAIYHFWLMDLFGNVPIVDKFAGAPARPANNTRAQVFAFIESEVNANVNQLSKNVDASTYGRVNFFVAQALLTKMYLNAQVYKGSPEFDKTIAAADQIINGGKYSLEGNYFANFNPTNNGSKENIFVIPYDEIFAQGFNLPQMTLHYGSQATFNLQQQPWNGYCTMEEFYNLYTGDANDTRRNNFLVGVQRTSGGAVILDSNAESADPDGQPLTFTPVVNELEPNALRQAGARVGKFQYKLGATPNLDNDYPLFRYADILLAKAEALCRKAGNWNDATARALFNQVRTRSGAAALATTTEQDYIDERGREMFAEAVRRQDLIRFNQFRLVPTRRPVNGTASAATRGLFPIPTNQRNVNPNLAQNPGY